MGDVGGTAGMDASFLPFLADRDVALFGGDTAHEVRDNIPGLDLTVVHKFAIVARAAQGGTTSHPIRFRSGSGGCLDHADLELDRRGIVVVVGDGIDVAGHRQNGGRRAGEGPRAGVERESDGKVRREVVG